MKVPLVDLKIQHERIKDEVQEAWDEIFSNTSYVLGPAVTAFEEEFARYCGVEHCIGVANGGDALELCLRALDIGAGDEVIIPANTFAATAMAVLQAGATPVAVDVDEAYHLIDPDRIAEAIGPRTRAIIPVHLFGQLAPMEPILAIATEHGLKVIEDAAQCQGATQHGMHAGQFGDMAATSFYPGKNLGAFGDGGAVLTRYPRLADRVRRLRNYGGVAKYEHLEAGRNSRLDTLQAAVLRVKLQYLDDWNDERRAAASAYDQHLREVEGVQGPSTLAVNSHAWHLYVVTLANRDEVLKAMTESGIGVGIHYPNPVTDIPGVRRSATCKTATGLSESILSLPLFPGISETQQSKVIEALQSAIRISTSVA